MNHNWIKSTLGHGESMCSRCFITNREAAVLGKLNECDVAETKVDPLVQPNPKKEEGLYPLPTWAQWPGDGPAPARWTAVNPETNEPHVIYRSYEDYCDD